ncbi:MAG TPA: PASTA domain-containing protein [Solirubrobacterales bacterium]|nr:PASTA domain-containing protein [Solirubrobacterales bacterium]
MRRRTLVLAAVATSLTLCSPASAALVTVGSPLTAEFNQFTVCGPVCILTNTQLAGPGAHATSPADGTVTRWRVVGAEESAFQLRVLRPDGSGDYTLVGTSAPGAPAGVGVETFATSLPIRAGDLIGLANLSASARLGFAAPTGSVVTQWSGTFPEGSSTSSAEALAVVDKEEAGFNADVEFASPPPPTVAAPPPAARCLVPKLAGKKLKAAKRKLKASQCKLGKLTKVEGATAATGRVKRQSPKPGVELAAGGKVNLTLKP